jgi:hypothetical protein
VKLNFKSYLKVITSLTLSMMIVVGGISHEATAVEPYKDLEISPMYFTDISMCAKVSFEADSDKFAKTCGNASASTLGSFQLPVTLWAFSVKNKGKSAYLNPRVEIVIQNETGADLYTNILVITKKIEPGEIVWVAPETNIDDQYVRSALTPHTQNAFQMTFQGMTKGFAKVISAKKSQPGKYRIKGFARGDIGSISDKQFWGYGTTQGYSRSYYYASAIKGVFKDWARAMPITIPVAVDARQVPTQWITVLYKESDGKILGGFKFANSRNEQAPYTRTLVQDYSFLKRIVFVEAYVSRR